MYVCMHIRLYVCMYVYTFVCMHVCIFYNMHVCMYMCKVCMFSQYADLHTEYIHTEAYMGSM